MPTEAELCGIFDVSRITIRRALDELVRIGMVDKRQGKGSYVRRSHLRSGDANRGFMDAMAERGCQVTTTLLNAAVEDIQPGIAALLGLDADPEKQYKAFHFRRLRFADGSPVAIMNTYVDLTLGGKMLGRDLERESFYGLYASILGQPIARTQGTVTAISPDRDACRLLGVTEGSAHLWYRSVGYLADGRAVEACFSIFNANRYEFTVSSMHPVVQPRLT